MALLGLLLAEAEINPFEYASVQDNMTLQELLEENETAYSRQVQYAVKTKLESGNLEETPLILLLAAITDFVCRSVGLGGNGSYSEKLYKLFIYEGQLPEPFFVMWVALAVATEFDTDLWEDYKIKLFEFRSKNNAARVYEERNDHVEIVSVADTEINVTGEPLQEEPKDSDSFDFDFSGFKK